MNSKKIENNIEFICNLCKRFLNMDIDESYFKQGLDSLELYLTYLGNSYIIRYDEYKDEFRLMHKNMSGAGREKTSYHLEFTAMSLVTIFKKLATRHNPYDMNSKLNHFGISKIRD